MLQKTTSIMIVFAFSVLLFPASAGEEIEEQDYGAALGMREGVTGEGLGLGLVLYPNQEGGCHYGCPIRPMGGVNLWPDRPYDHLALHFDDVAFTQPPNQVCFYDPADNLCGDGRTTEVACGDRSIADVPSGRDVVVFIYSIGMFPSLEVCLGSTGTLTGTFSERNA